MSTSLIVGRLSDILSSDGPDKYTVKFTADSEKIDGQYVGTVKDLPKDAKNFICVTSSSLGNGIISELYSPQIDVYMITNANRGDASTSLRPVNAASAVSYGKLNGDGTFTYPCRTTVSHNYAYGYQYTLYVW